MLPFRFIEIRDIIYSDDIDCKFEQFNNLKSEFFYKGFPIGKTDCPVGKEMFYKIILVEYDLEYNKYQLICISSCDEIEKEILEDKDKVIQFLNKDLKSEEIGLLCIGNFNSVDEYETWVKHPYFLCRNNYTSLKLFVKESLADIFLFFDCKENGVISNRLLNPDLAKNYLKFKEFVSNQNKEIYREIDFTKWSVYVWKYFFCYMACCYKTKLNLVKNIVSVILIECNYSEAEIFLLHKSFEDALNTKLDLL